MKLRMAVLSLLVLICQYQFASANVQDVNVLPDGVLLKLSQGQMKVNFITDKIVRVDVTKNEQWNQAPSLMRAEVTEKPSLIKVTAAKKNIELKSSRLIVRIDRKSEAVSYFDSDGKRLLTEAANPRNIERIDVTKPVPDPNTKVNKIETISGNRQVADKYILQKMYQAWKGQVNFTLSDNEALYGLGFDETTDLNLRGKSKLLYQHNFRIVMPSLVSTKNYGLLFDAYSVMSFKDDKAGMSVGFDVIQDLDYYFIAGDNMDGVIAGYRQLTGQATMLPKWAFGYVQSKERYKTQDELVGIVKEFRQRQIPLDVIVQDWQYWKKELWSNFQPEKKRYPDFAKMIEDLHKLNAHLMISIWPNPTLKDSPGRLLNESGFMYPGTSYVNFFKPGAAEMYFDLVWKNLGKYGVDSWWCDATEPITRDWVFPQRPENADQVNIEAFAEMIDRQFLNAYALVDNQGLYRNWRKTVPDKRMVNLTRSGYAGTQAAGTIVWTGDISAKWSILQRQVVSMMSFSASGHPYVNCDIGGFIVKGGNQWFRQGDYEKGVKDLGYRELYTRWLQFGTFLPMFRSHGTDTPREPWRFGEPNTPFYDAIVSSINLRYRLLPYFYCQAGMIHQKGQSFVRPLAFDFPNDLKTHDLKTQMLVGPALMVCPVLEPMYYQKDSKPVENTPRTRQVYLPAGKWIDFWTGQIIKGKKNIIADTPIERIPVYAKTGSIVPMGPVIQYADQMPDAPIELRIYPGADGDYTYYEDQGEGWGYEKGQFATIQMTWDDSKKLLTIKDRLGEFDGMIKERTFKIVLVGQNKGTGIAITETPSAIINYTGKSVTIRL